MPDRIRVFISSKEMEFGAQRQELRDGLNATEMFEVTLVEDMPPTRNEPRSVYLGAVQTSHIYIGLFGCLFSAPTREEYETALANPAREILIYEADCPSGREPALAALLNDIRRTSMTRRIGTDFVATVVRHLNAALISIVKKVVDSGSSPRTLGEGPAQRQWQKRRQALIDLGIDVQSDSVRKETVDFFRVAAARVLQVTTEG